MAITGQAVKRAAVALCGVTFLVISTLFLWNLYDLKAGIRRDISIKHQQHEQSAQSNIHDLELLLKAPFNHSDFAYMGERIASFGRLAAEVSEDESLDRKPLVNLFTQYFPWWAFSPQVYLPWDKQLEHQRTGIVICAGSKNMVFAIHLIRILRDVLHSKLPIQIAYAGDEDLNFKDRVKLTAVSENIETFNLMDQFDDAIGGLKDGTWALKPFSILGSRFQRVILADADAIFLKNPDKVFEEEPGLMETGTLFWHDRFFAQGNDGGRHAWFNSMMRDREPSAMLNRSLFYKENSYHEMDSATVIVDKGRPNVFMSLVFSTWMNTQKIREETTYVTFHGKCYYTFFLRVCLLNLAIGDKETFWLAAELSGTPYYFNPGYAGIIGHRNENEDNVCSSQALHLDHKKRPFWLNGSLRANKDYGHRRIAELTHWIGGAWNMTDKISWNYGGAEDGGWCVPHPDDKQPEKLNGTLYWKPVQEMYKTIKEVDDKYLGKEGRRRRWNGHV